MPVDMSFFAALLVGFFGGVHCIGMCGGIVGALTFGLPDEERSRFSRLAPYLLAYNLARTMRGDVRQGEHGALSVKSVPTGPASPVPTAAE